MHNAVSVDGRIDGFTLDLGLFYGLVSLWKEDATLVGSDTVLKAEGASVEIEEAVDPPNRDPKDPRPLLVVPDSRGRVRFWNHLRKQPYWRDVVVLCCDSTPRDYLDYLEKMRVDYLLAGEDHVDFEVALMELTARYGVRTVRVDSGGTLNGILLRAGLVDEVSVVVSPNLVGGMPSLSLFRAPDPTSPTGAIPLKLVDVERLEGDIVWLRYEVLRSR
jgi:2,5-diamino-6-(ribosylamino)-4(3H)-pyrimidinone 5'-phosphate reductase